MNPTPPLPPTPADFARAAALNVAFFGLHSSGYGPPTPAAHACQPCTGWQPPVTGAAMIPGNPTLATGAQLNPLPSTDVVGLDPVTQRLQELNSSQVADSKPLPPIRNGAWLRAAEIKLPPALIVGLLNRGDKMVLGGGSKSKKTWALIDLALSVATGNKWLNFDTEQTPVLYLNFEIQEPFFLKRLRAVAGSKGVQIPDYFHVWNLRGHSGSAGDLLARLTPDIKREGAGLIVLDPAYKLMPLLGSENDASTVAQFFNALERLAESTEAAVISAAHFSKGIQAGKEAMDRISGSGVFARDPDAIVTMTKHRVDGCFTIESTLRNFAEPTPFAVEWKFPQLVVRNDLNPQELKQSQAKYSSTDILNLLQVGESITTGDWLKRATDAHGISSSYFYKLRKELESCRPAVIENKGRLWLRVR